MRDPLPPKRKYVRAVGPRLRVVLLIVLGLVAVLSANSIYLAAITLREWLHRAERVSYQNYFYQLMFLAHLVLGLVLIVPFVVFGSAHLARAWNRPNRRVVMVGYWLFGLSLAVLVTGVLLMRADVFGFKNLGIKNPQLRSLTSPIGPMSSRRSWPSGSTSCIGWPARGSSGGWESAGHWLPAGR